MLLAPNWLTRIVNVSVKRNISLRFGLDTYSRSLSLSGLTEILQCLRLRDCYLISNSGVAFPFPCRIRGAH